jgi:hypothetical protein
MVEAGAPVRCTHSYWLPALDTTVIAGLVPTSIWLSRQELEDLDAGHATGERDPQDAIAPAVPYIYAAIIAVPLAASAIYGSLKIGDCREAIRWRARTKVSPNAGRAGQRCIPVLEGVDRCEPGLYCRRDRCEPLPPVGHPLTVGAIGQDCAVQMGALNGPMNREGWIKRWNQLSQPCQIRLRASCAAAIRELHHEENDNRRLRLEAAMRPACIRLVEDDQPSQD